MTPLETRLRAMLTKNEDGLLPCPNQWCHGIDIIQGEDSAGYRTIECRECGCGSRDTDEMSAIAAWNRRPLVRALVEAMRQRSHGYRYVWDVLSDRQKAEIGQWFERDDAKILALLDGKGET